TNMPTIHSIDVRPVSFRLKKPFVTAGGQKTETHNVQVTVRLEDGTCGLSEASSSIAMPSESQENLVKALKRMIPELRERPIESYRELVACSWRLQMLHPTAAAAMESAILDAYARTLKQSLSDFLGGKAVTIETDLTLSVGAPKDLHKQAKDAARHGF